MSTSQNAAISMSRRSINGYKTVRNVDKVKKKKKNSFISFIFLLRAVISTPAAL